MDSGSRNLPAPDAKEKNKSRDAASTSNAAAAAAAATSTREKIINKSIPHRFSFRSGPADKGKKQIKRGLSLSLRRSALWSTLHAKTMEIPERLRREERKLAKVPRLQIWLSTDQSPREPPAGEQQVLNNTREPLPKVHLDQPRAIYRSASEGTKWKIVVDGSSPPPQRDGIPGVSYDRNERPKSPVEKQPTWPMTQPHYFNTRPKLTHQDNIQLQLLHQQQQKQQQQQQQQPPQQQQQQQQQPSQQPQQQQPPQQQQQQRSVEGERRRLELPRQDAVAEETDTRETDPLKCSRSDSLHSDHGGPEMVTLSVNSMCSFSESGSPGSSRLSLRSELSRTHSLSQPPPRSRSNTVEKRSSFRLQIPGQDGSRPRRPSLLSLRSLARSLNPYFSIDYDYDSFDYDSTQAGALPYHQQYLPEPVPKLSFTQKLAFPTLVQNSIDRPKPRDPYMEAEHNMNTFAKIITIVVLALVTVLVLGVLYKLLH
ncbi:alpha-protein kinase 1-like isoform X2 [Portunus trituberculatus]|uniref:alpha-protein kinase 1-like isoform X2 n=1 Tax=Portunus trituberculatus TaxID=210409 RepID=UPI001E1CFC60|nr:alpha-protein kinase 1-like isoform X2 [Portunus trituberculatus]